MSLSTRKPMHRRTSMKAISLSSFALCIGLASADTVTVTVAPAVPSNEPQWRDRGDFTSAVLNSTNFYRAEHNASDVSWNSTLADFAGDYLDDNDCEFEHSGGPYGENLAIGYRNVTASIEAWGNERDEYNFKKGKFSEDTGHFTQLVWKNTTGVGCDRRLCGEQGWYLVCEYWPRGNVEGQFKQQVQEESVGVNERPRIRIALVVTMVYLVCWI